MAASSERLADPARAAAASYLAGTAPRAALDRLARLAARLLGARAAQISVIGDEQFVAGIHGVALPVEDLVSPAADSLCSVTVARGAPLPVEDATVDERVSHLPPVHSGLVRAYLGVPLVTSAGHTIGALCAFEGEPRAWSTDDEMILTELAASVVAELELAALAGELSASAAHLELGFAAAEIGSFDWNLRSGDLHWDERLMALFGYDASTYTPSFDSFSARVHEADLPRVQEAIDTAIATCGDFAAEYRVLLPDGEARWVAARGKVLCDVAGTPVRMLGAAYDTTSVRDARERIARVLETMADAFYSLDADWCFTYVNAPGEQMLRRRREDLLGRCIWDEFPEAVGTVFEEQYRRAVETGEPVTFEAFYPPLDGWFQLRAWPGPDGLAVYFTDVTERRHAEEERERHRKLVERASARLEVLAAAGARLSDTLHARRVLSTLADVVVPELGGWIVVAVTAEVAAALEGREAMGQPGEVAIVHVAHRDPGQRRTLEAVVSGLGLSIADEVGVGRVIATGEPEWLPEVTDEQLRLLSDDPERLEAMRGIVLGNALTVPLTSRGRRLGAITVADSGATHLDRRLIEDLAGRAAVALDNALLYGNSRRVGIALQRSLLPGSLPQLDGVGLAARYLPGVEGIEVGGDFYVAHELADGRLLLGIGDVMGRGVKAAAAMGQLRSVLLTLAYGGDPPDTVLDRLSLLVEDLLDLQMATALLAVYDPAARRLRLASAGHPPPLLAPLGDEPEYLDVTPGPPLGAGPADHPAEEVAVPSGATLVLYTDGLVEARGESLDVGMERLRDALRGVRLPPSAVCEHALRVTGRAEGSDDDVAIVAMSHL